MSKSQTVNFDTNGVATPTTTLTEAINHKYLQNAAKNIKDRKKVFEKLRRAMQIALPEGKKGLNDEGLDDIKTIEKNVTAFRNSDEMQRLIHSNVCYKKMIEQIDKYWEKLFADPIKVVTPSGPMLIQPQRTNNIMERLFRSIKHDWRRRSGTSSLSKKLKAILADTPLVKNLTNSEYLKIILNGSQTLAQRFSAIDPKIVRKIGSTVIAVVHNEPLFVAYNRYPDTSRCAL